MSSALLRTKSIDALIASSEEPERRLKKTLGVGSLIALGIGAVIGSGIFTVTGTAAAGEHYLGKSYGSPYNDYRRGPLSAQVAVIQCQSGDVVEAIAVLEDQLKRNGFSLPPRG